ncbi:MAG TPA: mechanosensitive ion channel domain-containing protein [Gemmatimonadaceae bacterium]|jgi:small-conductance mechanosensitive channel|nr:mechanosensitive ion channel domain-containing protein [Gemmatimonadaceae bacterium]
MSLRAPAAAFGLYDLLHDEVLGNSLRAWIIATATAAALFVVLLVGKRLLVSRLDTVAKRSTNRFDDMVVATFAKTRTWVLLAFSIIVGFGPLSIPSVSEFFRPAAKLILLFQIALWGTAAIGFWVKHHLDNRETAGERASVAMIRTIGVGANVLLWLLLVITAFHAVLAIDVTPWIASLGVGGVAIALAVQNILGDLLATLAIVFDKPFDLGDNIGVDNITGVVEHIGIKTTRLRSQTGEQIVIGNADLIKSRLRNFRRMYQRRISFPLDLAFDTPPDALAALTAAIEKIVTAQSPVQFDRCHVSSIAEAGIRIETVYYVLDPDYKAYMNAQQAINLEILKRLHADDIALATTSSVSILRPPQSTAR